MDYRTADNYRLHVQINSCDCVGKNKIIDELNNYIDEILGKIYQYNCSCVGKQDKINKLI